MSGSRDESGLGIPPTVKPGRPKPLSYVRNPGYSLATEKREMDRVTGLRGRPSRPSLLRVSVEVG